MLGKRGWSGQDLSSKGGVPGTPKVPRGVQYGGYSAPVGTLPSPLPQRRSLLISGSFTATVPLSLPPLPPREDRRGGVEVRRASSLTLSPMSDALPGIPVRTDGSFKVRRDGSTDDGNWWGNESSGDDSHDGDGGPVTPQSIVYTTVSYLARYSVPRDRYCTPLHPMADNMAWLPPPALGAV